MTQRMHRIFAVVGWLALLCTAAQAHFVFVLPQNGGQSATIIMNETLEASSEVDVAFASDTKLHLRDAHGADTPLDLTEGDNVYTTALPGHGTRVVHGLTDLGLMNRGTPHLLLYYPKTIIGDAFDPHTQVGGDAMVEIVPHGEPGDVRLQLLARGKPQPDSEITVLLPDGTSKIVKTDAKGLTESFHQHGRYGAWGRFWEDKESEHEGVVFKQVRHYATLVFDADGAAQTSEAATDAPKVFAKMPEPSSSFGSVTVGDWLYVYGGHVSPTHVYHTQGVSGNFARVCLTGEPVWENLPSGPGLQGMNLTAHDGMVYRVGGMAPRNAKGEKSDNHSVAYAARFDPKTKSWEDLPPLPTPRSSHDAVVLDDKLYVVGGWTMKGGDVEWSETMLVMDLSAKKLKWKEIPQPFRRRALMAAAFDGKIHVVGGFSDENKVLLNLSIYDPATESWSEGPKLPEGDRTTGFSPAVGVDEGRLFASVADGRLLCLDGDGQAWTEIGRSTPRVAHRLAFRGEHVLVLGGAAKGDNFDLIEAVSVDSD